MLPHRAFTTLRKGDFMATSTFDKTIYIDQEAAEKMAALLDEPSPPDLTLVKTFGRITKGRSKNGCPAPKSLHKR